MQKIEGIIFDIDGTLVDSEVEQTKSWHQALREAGFHTSEDSIREVIGIGGYNVLPYIAKINRKTVRGQQIEQRRTNIFHEFHLKNIKPRPFAQQLLEELQKLRYKIVAASANSREDLTAILKQTGLYSLVDEVVSAEEAASGNPDANVLAAALRRVKLPASHVVLLGNTPYDLETATSLGMNSIGFTTGHWGKEDLGEAATLYTGPEDLLKDLRSRKHKVLQVQKQRGKEVPV